MNLQSNSHNIFYIAWHVTPRIHPGRVSPALCVHSWLMPSQSQIKASRRYMDGWMADADTVLPYAHVATVIALISWLGFDMEEVLRKFGWRRHDGFSWRWIWPWILVARRDQRSIQPFSWTAFVHLSPMLDAFFFWETTDVRCWCTVHVCSCSAVRSTRPES
jgi:hypothetical protein